MSKNRSTAPVGLALAFRLIREEDEKAHVPHLYANRVHLLAQEIIEGDAEQRTDVFARSVAAVFPNMKINPTEETSVEAGFYVGFATCWLILQQLQTGGAR